MVPGARATPEASKDWTYDTQLKMAEAVPRPAIRSAWAAARGSTDANQTWGATFGAFGADLVDDKGNITVDSDNVMAAHGVLPEAGASSCRLMPAVG